MWQLIIAIPSVLLGGLGVLLWMGARERRGTFVRMTRLRRMSDSEAKKLALEIMARPPFHVRAASKVLVNPDLPSHVLSLFGFYEEVTRGEFWLGTSALDQTPRLSGFIKIDEDSEFTEILVRPGDSKIIVASGHEPPSASAAANLDP